MQITDNISIKSFYRFIEYVSKFAGKDMPHERYKLIALDKYQVESKDEIKIKRLTNAYLFILNNTNQILTLEMLQMTYYLLTTKYLSNKIAKKILETYYKFYNEPSHYLASLIHFKVLDNVKKQKIEYAFLLSNYIMLKKNRYPLVPSLTYLNSYNGAIINKNIDKLIIVFSKMETPYNLKNNENKTKNWQIIKLINEYKDDLKNIYSIEKLFLYGSQAKNFTNKNSDIDMLVIFNEEEVCYEKYDIIKMAKEYLSTILNCHVDLIDFKNALYRLNIKEMENIITLI